MSLFGKKKDDKSKTDSPKITPATQEYELHKAVVKGNFPKISALILAGFPVNQIDGHGLTALDLAYVHDNSKIIRFLEEHGALKSKNLNKESTLKTLT